MERLVTYYGPWNSVYRLWDEIFAHISKNSNDECNMIDSTAFKTDQHSYGKGLFFQAIGRSLEDLVQEFMLYQIERGSL